MVKIETVKKFIEHGFSVVPVNEKKIPVGAWKVFQSRVMNESELSIWDDSRVNAIAIVGGVVSGGLEMIDIDSKYDITGTMYKRYIDSVPTELKEKLVIQTTANKGYHIIYRCSKIEGNQKLAQRHCTEDEKKTKPDEKRKVLFETRGEGGYFLVQPSIGYKVIQGLISNVPVLSEVERDFLLELARSFNEVYEQPYEPVEAKANDKYFIKSPFEDYNDRVDVPSLLEEHGWTVARQNGAKYLMRRPNTENQWSAEYDRNKNWFTVFSTSTEFETLKAYKPYSVWAVLNGKTDWSEVNKELIKMGYGVKNQHYEPTNKKQSPLFAEEIEDDGDISYTSIWGDVRLKVEDYIEGRIPEGLSTGYDELDEYFRFKRGNLVVINGLDNAGKSTFILWLMVIAAVLHGWKWILYMSENSDLNIMNLLIMFYCGKPIKKTTFEERNEAQMFIERHFIHIKPDELVDYKTLKKQFIKIHKYIPVDGIFIDPYNSLDNSTSANTHEMAYSIITDMKLWGRKNDVSIYLNTHAVTSAIRKKDEEGYVLAPDKGDTEGGTKFAAKADEFITIHRVANHIDETTRKITEVHVRKVKDTMTGGKQTPKDNPFKVIWANFGSMFLPLDSPKHPFTSIKDNLDFEDIYNQNPPF